MEPEGLSFDNILGAEEIENLFTEDSPPTKEENNESENTDSKEKEEKEENQETTEINVEDLFTESESVGSEEKIEEKEDTNSQKGDGSSQTNFYSSIAKALKEEGIFPDLEDDFSKVSTPEDFRDLIEQQIKAEFDERQKRIDEALSAGVEPSEIKRYEGTLNFLDSIQEETIKEEGEQGEKLRKDLIYQDFVNRGYSKERALREVEKSFNAGTDIEDATEALKGNKEFYQGRYDNLLQEAKKEAEELEKNRREQAEKLKNSILSDKDVFGDLSVDKSTRQKVYDNISKPVYKDPETGEMFTAIQKYEMDNRIDFLKNVGLIFTLTEGFKNLDGLVKNKVKKEVKKGLKELEVTLSNTSRTSDGSLKFATDIGDSESFIGKGWNLDL
nr:MAG TPA: hypothetical protein [Crassvirales sp.]